MDHVLPDEIVEKAKAVVDANRAAGRRIALAESCTGGLVSAALTEISGASDVFMVGFVTYSNAAKRIQLNVNAEIIEREGAVSEDTAAAMARGALLASGADIAVSITGVAGPTGGSKEKPVGLVIFGVATRSGERPTTQRHQFDTENGRAGIRCQAALTALSLLEP
ncbi:CinA family protein [Sphingomicrobium lutaoense]|nr:CinA family protein [Sphingomicrobium lutaoense]